ncbi:MAG: hypothetical protein LBF49_01860 [Puniceicoccales bacterium]|nr:hypothetical protein [Puniceicoccales bacterium]
MLELIFVLTLMGAFTACFVIRPFRFKDDVVHDTSVALSELVFLARLQSMSSGTPVTLAVAEEEFDSLSGSSGLEIQRGWKKYGQKLDPRISDFVFVNFPRGCKSSDFPQNPFKAGEIPLDKVVFEEKFFTPFQLKFSFDDEERYIAVDANAQIHIH